MRVLIGEWPLAGARALLRAYFTERRGGVRIYVFNKDGVQVFDTNDCYDMANAINSVEQFVKANPESVQ